MTGFRVVLLAAVWLEAAGGGLWTAAPAAAQDIMSLQARVMQLEARVRDDAARRRGAAAGRAAV